MTKRIYVVTEKGSDNARLIEAGTQAAAVQVAIRGRFTVEPASGLQVAELMKAGVEVEPAPGGAS